MARVPSLVLAVVAAVVVVFAGTTHATTNSEFLLPKAERGTMIKRILSLLRDPCRKGRAETPRGLADA
jgi:hypothetical protein